MQHFLIMKQSSLNCFKRLLSSAVLITTVVPHAVHASPEIAGKWRAVDGSVTVDVAPCSGTTNLCATVIAETLLPGEQSSLGAILVKDIYKDAKKGWQGKFNDGKSTHATSISFKENGQADFKVCAVLFLCETQSFARLP
jgi:uncharacterized protein (DUF2147 family)